MKFTNSNRKWKITPEVVPFYGSEENSSQTISEGLFTQIYCFDGGKLRPSRHGDTRVRIFGTDLSQILEICTHALELRKQKLSQTNEFYAK